MLKSYRLINNRLIPTSPLKTANIIIAANPTTVEQKLICTAWDLEPLTFAFCNSPEEVSRFQTINSSVLPDATLLVLYDFIKRQQTIERQLAPAIIIFNKSHLLICTENVTSCLEELNQLSATSASLFDFVFHCINHWQDHLISALLSYKTVIDRLDTAARQTIENHELRTLTTLTRKLVLFEHTMNDQSETLMEFLASSKLAMVNQDIILNTKIKQRRLTKTIHIYRDLLASISSLFTAMMDNHLNHLMKYLDSAGLIIAVIALVTGFMGMNVGGMPWKNSASGFILTCTVAVILAVITGLHLKHKKYTD
jgi:magnesium transporter